MIDNKLRWISNHVYVYIKMQKRLHFLKKLTDFNVCEKIELLFYKSVIESVLTFALLVNYGKSNSKHRSKLLSVIKRSSKFVGRKCSSLNELYKTTCEKNDQQDQGRLRPLLAYVLTSTEVRPHWNFHLKKHSSLAMSTLLTMQLYLRK